MSMVGAEPMPFWKLREFIGQEDAEILAEAFAGRKVFVPANPREDSPIVAILGMESARRLADRLVVYGPETMRGRGCAVEVPMGGHGALGSAQRRVISMIEQDLSDSEICSRAGVCERTVRRWRARLGKSRPRRFGPDHPQVRAMAGNPSINAAEIVERTGVTGKTACKWIKHFAAERAANMKIAAE